VTTALCANLKAIMANTLGNQKIPYSLNEKDESTKHVENVNEKTVTVSVESIEEDSGKRRNKSLATARELVTEILSVEDDPTQNPWTFRMWFIGLGMSVFAG
jgi:hypothetical protein